MDATRVAFRRGGRGVYWLCPNFLAWRIKPPERARDAFAAFWGALPRMITDAAHGGAEAAAAIAESQDSQAAALVGRLMRGRCASGRVRVIGGGAVGSVVAIVRGSQQPGAEREHPGRRGHRSDGVGVGTPGSDRRESPGEYVVEHKRIDRDHGNYRTQWQIDSAAIDRGGHLSRPGYKLTHVVSVFNAPGVIHTHASTGPVSGVSRLVRNATWLDSLEMSPLFMCTN